MYCTIRIRVYVHTYVSIFLSPLLLSCEYPYSKLHKFLLRSGCKGLHCYCQLDQLGVPSCAACFGIGKLCCWQWVTSVYIYMWCAIK